MSTPNGQPRRPGILDSLKAAFVPKPIEYDSDTPNELPKTVKIAGFMSIFSGVLFLWFAIQLFLDRSSYLDAAIDSTNKCKDLFGQIGAGIPATEVGEDADYCRSAVDTTPDYLSSLSTTITIFAIVALVLGLALAWCGWNLSKGRRWARRVLTSIGILLFAMTMLNLVFDIRTLAGGMILIVGLAMCYIGKGATYFIRAKAAGDK